MRNQTENESAPVRDPSDTLQYWACDARVVSEAEFSAEERDVLDRVNQKVAAARTLDEAMNFLFDATSGMCPCDRIGLAFLEDDGRRVVAQWARATYEPLLLGNGFAQDLQGSSLETVLRSGSPRVISDLEQYLKEHPESVSTRIIVEEGIRSSMTCPLIVEDRAVGFLFRSSRRPNAYDRHQVRLHQAVAERLSQAVEKAWRIEQLTAASRAYSEILGFVSHELKSPLASLMMDIEGMQAGYLGPLTVKQRVKLERMTGKAQYLLSLIGDYLNLARIESGPTEPKVRPDVEFLSEVVNPSIELVQNLIDQQRVTLHRDLPLGRAHVGCDPSLMVIALVNLLANAVKYGEDQGEIRLTVARSDSVLRVSVWNRGPGFPPQERDKLFRRFSRLQTPELLKRKGTGVGLYTTWRIVQMHGGRIRAESEPGQWAEFVIEIPQPLGGKK